MYSPDNILEYTFIDFIESNTGIKRDRSTMADIEDWNPKLSKQRRMDQIYFDQSNYVEIDLNEVSEDEESQNVNDISFCNYNVSREVPLLLSTEAPTEQLVDIVMKQSTGYELSISIDECDQFVLSRCPDRQNSGKQSLVIFVDLSDSYGQKFKDLILNLEMFENIYVTYVIEPFYDNNLDKFMNILKEVYGELHRRRMAVHLTLSHGAAKNLSTTVADDLKKVTQTIYFGVYLQPSQGVLSLLSNNNFVKRIALDISNEDLDDPYDEEVILDCLENFRDIVNSEEFSSVGNQLEQFDICISPEEVDIDIDRLYCISNKVMSHVRHMHPQSLLNLKIDRPDIDLNK